MKMFAFIILTCSLLSGCSERGDCRKDFEIEYEIFVSSAYFNHQDSSQSAEDIAKFDQLILGTLVYDNSACQMKREKRPIYEKVINWPR